MLYLFMRNLIEMEYVTTFALFLNYLLYYTFKFKAIIIHRAIIISILYIHYIILLYIYIYKYICYFTYLRRELKYD